MRGGFVGRTRTTSGVDERFLDRLDPSRKLDRLSRFLWYRERLATLRGHWMYFYTDLKNRNGNGLAGVNVNNGGRVDVRRLWQSINRPQIKLMS